MAWQFLSAKLASELVLGCVHNINQSRANLEESYKKWARHFLQKTESGPDVGNHFTERLSNFFNSNPLNVSHILTVIIKRHAWRNQFIKIKHY
jgi:hypothetical protein